MGRIQSSSLAFALAMISGVCTPCSAEPIRFTYTGTASGTLAGSAFGPASFFLECTADTTNVTDQGGAWRVTHDNATMSIGDLPPITITTPTTTAVNNLNGAVIFGNGAANLALLIIGEDPQLTTWDLASSIGPISNRVYILQWGPIGLDTTQGPLALRDSYRLTFATFEAAIIPAPAAPVLTLTGLFIAIRRVPYRSPVRPRGSS